MAIDRTETTAGAPPPGGGLTAQEELSCSREEWRPSGRQGKKVSTTLLRRSGRGEAGLRPDQAIEEAVWSGLDTGSRRRRWRQAPSQADRTGPHRQFGLPLPSLAHCPTPNHATGSPPLTGSATARRCGLARPTLWTGQEQGLATIRRNATDEAPNPSRQADRAFSLWSPLLPAGPSAADQAPARIAGGRHACDPQKGRDAHSDRADDREDDLAGF